MKKLCLVGLFSFFMSAPAFAQFCYGPAYGYAPAPIYGAPVVGGYTTFQQTQVTIGYGAPVGYGYYNPGYYAVPVAPIYRPYCW